MKRIMTVMALGTLVSFASAESETPVLNSAPIEVDGYIRQEEPVDSELTSIQEEIKRQKTEIVLNKEKAKHFKELSKSVEKLSETTEEMIEEKKQAQAEIAEYNTKVKCLQEENPGPECDKYVRRRR